MLPLTRPFFENLPDYSGRSWVVVLQPSSRAKGLTVCPFGLVCVIALVIDSSRTEILGGESEVGGRHDEARELVDRRCRGSYGVRRSGMQTRESGCRVRKRRMRFGEDGELRERVEGIKGDEGGRSRCGEAGESKIRGDERECERVNDGDKAASGQVQVAASGRRHRHSVGTVSGTGKNGRVSEDESKREMVKCGFGYELEAVQVKNNNKKKDYS